MKKMYTFLLHFTFCCLVFIAPNAKAQTASFTTTADTVCQDSCITFINTSTGAIDSIGWAVHGITITNPHSDTISVCFPSASIDTVWLYVYDSGRVDTAMRIVEIKQKPHPRLTFVPCTLSVPDVYTSYQWYYFSGSPISGATANSLITYASITERFFIVVDSNGCFGHSDTLHGCVEGAVRNVYKGDNTSLFPNPAANELTILASYTIATVSITNLIGQTLYTHQYNTQQVQIDVADLPKGLYLVTINGSEVRKFVKE